MGIKKKVEICKRIGNYVFDLRLDLNVLNENQHKLVAKGEVYVVLITVFFLGERQTLIDTSNMTSLYAL